MNQNRDYCDILNLGKCKYYHYITKWSVDGQTNQGVSQNVQATILTTNVSVVGTNITSETSSNSDYKAYKGQTLVLNTFDINSTASNSAWSGSDKRAIRWGTESKASDNQFYAGNWKPNIYFNFESFTMAKAIYRKRIICITNLPEARKKL